MIYAHPLRNAYTFVARSFSAWCHEHCLTRSGIALDLLRNCQLIILPEVCWTSFPFGLTLEGQYIIKNLAIIGSALVLGATVRGGRIDPEPVKA